MGRIRSIPLMSVNGKDSQAVTASPARRRASWPLITIAALFIVVPFLTWYGTWFGRDLSDEKIAEYLIDEKNPRHVQHALLRVEERIEKGDPAARKFYPQIIALARSPTGEIRKTVAWVMGQDKSSTEFHQALVGLLSDTEPLVRRNAALQLVRFGDAAGRLELRAMLQPFELKSPMAGSVVSVLPQGTRIKAGGLVARIRDASSTLQEFRSPVDGAIGSLAAKEGDAVTVGQTVAWVTPDRSSVDAALQALAFVGTKDDLPLIEPFTQENATSDAEIKRQALFATTTIESRVVKN